MEEGKTNVKHIRLTAIQNSVGRYQISGSNGVIKVSAKKIIVKHGGSSGDTNIARIALNKDQDNIGNNYETIRQGDTPYEVEGDIHDIAYYGVGGNVPLEITLVW
jgi:hypothetical protein